MQWSDYVAAVFYTVSSGVIKYRITQRRYVFLTSKKPLAGLSACTGMLGGSVTYSRYLIIHD